MAALRDCSSYMTHFADLTTLNPGLYLVGAVGVGVGVIRVRVNFASDVRIVDVGIVDVGIISVGVIGVGVIDIEIVSIGLISVGAVSPLAPMGEVRSLVVTLFSFHNLPSSTII